MVVNGNVKKMNMRKNGKLDKAIIEKMKENISLRDEINRLKSN